MAAKRFGLISAMVGQTSLWSCATDFVMGDEGVLVEAGAWKANFTMERNGSHECFCFAMGIGSRCCLKSACVFCFHMKEYRIID